MPARLSMCTLTIHALLQSSTISLHRPYVTLDKYIAEDAMLTQMKMRYNLYNELSLTQKRSKGKGHSVTNCKSSNTYAYENLTSFQILLVF